MGAEEVRLQERTLQLPFQGFEVAMKKIYLLTLAFLGVIPVVYSIGAVEPDCTLNLSNEITDTSTCKSQSTKLVTTIYKLGLCTSLPTAPTSNLAPDFSSCQTVFENSQGGTVTVNNKTGEPLSGTMTKPANGTYTYGYVILSNDISIQQAISFNSSRTVLGGGSSGNVCWTKNGTLWRLDGYNPAYVECGTSAGSNLGLTKTMYNTLDGENSFVESAPAINLTGAPLNTMLYQYLVGSDLKLKGQPSSNTSMGDIARGMFVIGPFDGIVIDDTVTGMDLGFSTSRGMKVKFDGAGNIKNIKNGELFYNLTVKH